MLSKPATLTSAHVEYNLDASLIQPLSFSQQGKLSSLFSLHRKKLNGVSEKEPCRRDAYNALKENSVSSFKTEREGSRAVI